MTESLQASRWSRRRRLLLLWQASQFIENERLASALSEGMSQVIQDALHDTGVRLGVPSETVLWAMTRERCQQILKSL